jgi:glycerophosphoryl diester phosphodiesterase
MYNMQRKPMVKHPSLFQSLKKPYNLAHQGGALLAPANTMAAFAIADSLTGVDFLDIDIHMSRDGQLVCIHDHTVNNTTNGRGRVDELTLEELQKLDAGYYFQDVQGQYSYRGQGVRIPTVEEVFETYAANCYFHFEVKDAYPRTGPSQIEEKLLALIREYHLEQKVIVASFQQRIVNRFIHLSNGQIVTGAGQGEVIRFVLAQKFHVPVIYQRKVDVLEIPTRSAGINLADPHLILAAHQLGMEVYYWTVDEREVMKQLLNMGADGIFSNRPDILQQVIHEIRQENGSAKRD